GGKRCRPRMINTASAEFQPILRGQRGSAGRLGWTYPSSIVVMPNTRSRWIRGTSCVYIRAVRNDSRIPKRTANCSAAGCTAASALVGEVVVGEAEPPPLVIGPRREHAVEADVAPPEVGHPDPPRPQPVPAPPEAGPDDVLPEEPERGVVRHAREAGHRLAAE